MGPRMHTLGGGTSVTETTIVVGALSEYGERGDTSLVLFAKFSLLSKSSVIVVAIDRLRGIGEKPDAL